MVGRAARRPEFDGGPGGADRGPGYGLDWHVGDAFLVRARSVLARGCVQTCIEVGPGVLHATVGGTRSWPYDVTVEYAFAGGRVTSFEGTCDCPVELDCKHAVAALLYHLGVGPGARVGPAERPAVTAVRPPPAWQASLSHLLESSLADASAIRPADRDRAPTQLGLRLSFGPAAGRYATVGLRIRPIRYNERNRWVQGGVSWSDLRYLYYTAQYQPEQLQSVRAIAELEQRRRPYESPASWISVDGPAGPLLWEGMVAAQQAGVSLMIEGSDAPAEFADEPAEMVLDLVRTESVLRCRPAVRLGGRNLAADGVRLIGMPAHGVLVVASADRPESGPVVLARFRRPLPAEMTTMLRGGPIEIPAADEARFLREFLPALRRRVPVLSGDGSVPVPEPTPPRVALTATREPGHRIGLHWQWQDESDRRGDLDERRGMTGPDRAALRQAVAGLLAATWLPAGAIGTGADGPEPLARYLLEGSDSVRFMTQAWPALVERPDVITALDGADAGLRYRHTDSSPVLDVHGDDSADDGGARDWFDLAVRVTVDGEQVPFELIFRALADDDPMIILPSGTYLELDDHRWARLRELIEESRAMDDGAPGELRIDRYTASRWVDLEESGLLSARAAQWRDRIGRLAVGAGRASAPPPPGMHADLRGYQQEGLDWLRERFDQRLGGILADDMGLGKTLQMLGLIAHARDADPDGPPLLVIAPTSVIGNWITEAARFTPGLRAVAVTQGGRRRAQPLADAVAGADLVVTSYQLFRLGIDEYRGLPWAGLILDEAQFVKNVQSKGFRCVRDFPAPVTFAVTGTPLENNVLELWGLLALAVPGLFPDSHRFTEHYRLPIERGGEPDRLAQLRRRVAPFLLRRTKEQVAPELPAKVEQVVDVELSPRHRQVYQRHLQRERQRILGLLKDDRSLEDNRFQILRSLTLLRQLSLDPMLVDPGYADIASSKLDVVMQDLSQIIAAGHRVLVFSQFTGFLDRAADRMDALGIEHCRLDGRTRERAAVVQSFRAGSVPVFLISLKAGGFGLNLTEADYCLLLDPWWNPAAEAQAIDRTHRIGQTRSVIVHRYVARDTIEDKVMALKAGKAKLFDDVLGAAGDTERGPRTPLTAAEIRDLLA